MVPINVVPATTSIKFERNFQTLLPSAIFVVRPIGLKLPYFYRFVQCMKKMTFSIPQDSTIYKGDTVVFSLNGTFVSLDSLVPQKAYVSFSAEYEDSVSTADTMLLSSGPVSLSLVLSNRYKISFIRGSVNYLDETDNRSSFLVLSDINLMRYHEKNEEAPLETDSVPSAELGTDDGGSDSDVE